MTRRHLLGMISVLAVLLWASSASATTDGTVTAALTPNTIAAASTASLSITGLPGGLPHSIEVLFQKGFTASARSVPVLCTTSQAANDACPSASRIGAGTAGITLLVTPQSAPVKLFLGQPTQTGDVASVILEISFDGADVSVSGRLFVPAQGGLELLISSFPSAPVTLNSLSLSAGATQTTTRTVVTTVTKIVTRGKGKHRHKRRVKVKVKKKVKTVESLLTNPSTCSGTWTGTVTLDYANGSDSVPFAAACTGA